MHPNSAMTWYNARKGCLDAGGDLLRVDNDEILDALTVWLGAAGRQTLWWIDGVNELWNWDDGKYLLDYVTSQRTSRCDVMTQ